MMMYSYILRTWEIERERLGVQGQSRKYEDLLQKTAVKGQVLNGRKYLQIQTDFKGLEFGINNTVTLKQKDKPSLNTDKRSDTLLL